MDRPCGALAYLQMRRHCASPSFTGKSLFYRLWHPRPWVTHPHDGGVLEAMWKKLKPEERDEWAQFAVVLVKMQERQ